LCVLSPLPGSGRGHAVGNHLPSLKLAAPALLLAGMQGRGQGPLSGARDRAGLTKGSDKLRAAPDCQPGTWGAGLRRVVFRLGYSSKSAGRLAKI